MKGGLEEKWHGKVEHSWVARNPSRMRLLRAAEGKAATSMRRQALRPETLGSLNMATRPGIALLLRRAGRSLRWKMGVVSEVVWWWRRRR